MGKTSLRIDGFRVCEALSIGAATFGVVHLIASSASWLIVDGAISGVGIIAFVWFGLQRDAAVAERATAERQEVASYPLPEATREARDMLLREVRNAEAVMANISGMTSSFARDTLRLHDQLIRATDERDHLQRLADKLPLIRRHLDTPVPLVRRAPALPANDFADTPEPGSIFRRGNLREIERADHVVENGRVVKSRNGETGTAFEANPSGLSALLRELGPELGAAPPRDLDQPAGPEAYAGGRTLSGA